MILYLQRIQLYVIDINRHRKRLQLRNSHRFLSFINYVNTTRTCMRRYLRDIKVIFLIYFLFLPIEARGTYEAHETSFDSDFFSIIEQSETADSFFYSIR